MIGATDGVVDRRVEFLWGDYSSGIARRGSQANTVVALSGGRYIPSDKFTGSPAPYYIVRYYQHRFTLAVSTKLTFPRVSCARSSLVDYIYSIVADSLR